MKEYYEAIFENTNSTDDSVICYPTIYFSSTRVTCTGSAQGFAIIGLDCFLLEVQADDCPESQLLATFTCDATIPESPLVNVGYYATVLPDDSIIPEDYFSTIDNAIELVFGERASVGFVCSLSESVANDGKTLPGYCCLDAPYSTTNVDAWGQPVSAYMMTMRVEQHKTWIFQGLRASYLFKTA